MYVKKYEQIKLQNNFLAFYRGLRLSTSLLYDKCAGRTHFKLSDLSDTILLLNWPEKKIYVTKVVPENLHSIFQ